MFNLVFQITTDTTNKSLYGENWTEEFITGIELFTEVPESQVKAIAEDFKESIKSNIFYGKDYFGKPLPPLSPVTIQKKGHAKPLLHTFELYNSIEVQKITDGFEVFILPGRAEIGYNLHTGEFEPNPQKKQFEFFGVTDITIDEAVERIFQ